jgi:hypothetical protein
MTIRVTPENARAAVLDAAHIGDIQGAFGTILAGDVAPRKTWKRRLTTLLAILGPGLIVMVGDNDQRPMYFQLLFALDRVKALAPRHQDLNHRSPRFTRPDYSGSTPPTRCWRKAGIGC